MRIEQAGPEAAAKRRKALHQHKAEEKRRTEQRKFGLPFL